MATERDLLTVFAVIISTIYFTTSYHNHYQRHKNYHYRHRSHYNYCDHHHSMAGVAAIATSLHFTSTMSNIEL
jgi:site-specific DNA-adenine methylase